MCDQFNARIGMIFVKTKDASIMAGELALTL